MGRSVAKAYRRDLLPLIEGTTVATQYGPIKTATYIVHRLRRLPCRQTIRPAARTPGRLPIRVELAALTGDFVRTLSSTRASLTEQ